MENVMLEIKNNIACLTINRQEQLNTFNYEVLTELETALDDIKLNKEVRVVIVTGAGEKAFSAGADLKERRTLTEKQVRRNVNKIRDVFLTLEELPQPSIAAINGYALGGGFELALACDFRIAVDDATLGLPEVSWAIVPGAGGTQRLPRLIGISKAKEWILTARKVKAQEAVLMGAVNKSVPREKLWEEVNALAYEMMNNAPLAVAQAKYAMNNGSNTDIYSGLKIESQAYERIIPTKDRIEALEAFKEKRKPQFRGE
ncbi:enoyl-CoA hydratase-related protein [Aquibacillus sp. 3ASR75-11]|uniref:Enoyl-CoA hydratase-related protein n=1 Tax=Terrihalobacillus insolitus TaxID=2950438 RepID=A0A9X3WSJ8_9BACI|nr:enoyl-CoA hydratase-related protein [Terrihalobacillus insolitus]MDC3415165.1 enoyl-CoA hydratase-related protein [Terrihalobacillus insolitus]MDC3424063.1 enoyl-CoA hydratase-related protein [Terrihalobacillus insolitus]